MIILVRMADKLPYNQKKSNEAGLRLWKDWVNDGYHGFTYAFSYWHANNVDDLAEWSNLKRHQEDLYWGALVLTNSHLLWGGAELNNSTTVALPLSWIEKLSIYPGLRPSLISKPPPVAFQTLNIQISDSGIPDDLLPFPGVISSSFQPTSIGDSYTWTFAISTGGGDNLVNGLKRRFPFQQSSGYFWDFESRRNSSVFTRRIKQDDPTLEKASSSALGPSTPKPEITQRPLIQIETTPDPVYCTKCGTSNRTDSNYCFRCGTQLVGKGPLLDSEVPRFRESPASVSERSGPIETRGRSERVVAMAPQPSSRTVKQRGQSSMIPRTLALSLSLLVGALAVFNGFRILLAEECKSVSFDSVGGRRVSVAQCFADDSGVMPAWLVSTGLIVFGIVVLAVALTKFQKQR